MNAIFSRTWDNILLGTAALTTATRAFAQSANNSAIFGQIPDVGGQTGTSDVRVTVINVLKTVLSFMALVAVVFIVIAGIRLVVSQGEDEERDKAKKTIIYVVVGLVVILLARTIVGFIADAIATSID